MCIFVVGVSFREPFERGDRGLRFSSRSRKAGEMREYCLLSSEE